MSWQRTFLPQFPPTLHIPLFISAAPRGPDSPSEDWRTSRHATRKSRRPGRAFSSRPILNLEERRKDKNVTVEEFMSGEIIEWNICCIYTALFFCFFFRRWSILIKNSYSIDICLRLRQHSIITTLVFTVIFTHFFCVNVFYRASYSASNLTLLLPTISCRLFVCAIPSLFYPKVLYFHTPCFYLPGRCSEPLIWSSRVQHPLSWDLFCCSSGNVLMVSPCCYARRSTGEFPPCQEDHFSFLL